jgi:hypothetical protein
MKRHWFARGLLAGATSVLALTGAAGVASADPTPDPLPPIVDHVAPVPGRTLDPPDRGAPTSDWDGAGMYCENQLVQCR